MSALMVAPMGAVTVPCGATMADDTRAMHGQHPAAASSGDIGGDGIGRRIIVIVGIVVRVVVVIHAADKHAVEVMMMMEERMAGPSGTSRNSRGSCADRSTANGGAAEGTTRKAAARTAAKVAATTASSAMTAANFNRRSVRRRLAGNRRSRIKRRHRLGPLAGKDQSHQQRRDGARYAQRISRTNQEAEHGYRPSDG